MQAAEGICIIYRGAISRSSVARTAASIIFWHQAFRRWLAQKTIV